MLFSPDHLVDNTCVALDELYDLGAYIFVRIVRYRYSVVTIADHLNSYVDCLEEVVLIDAGEDEAAFIEGFRALGGRTNADCRE